MYSSGSHIATICISHIEKICPIHSDVRLVGVCVPSDPYDPPLMSSRGDGISFMKMRLTFTYTYVPFGSKENKITCAPLYIRLALDEQLMTDWQAATPWLLV